MKVVTLLAVGFLFAATAQDALAEGDGLGGKRHPSEAQQRAVAQASTPAENASIKARIVDISDAEDFPAVFNALDRSRFVFAGREITSKESRSGALWRSPLRFGEPLLPYYLYGDEVMAQTLDGQTISVEKSMLLLSPPERGVSFPTVGELDVEVPGDAERPQRVGPQPAKMSGAKLGKLPEALMPLASQAKGRDAFFASQSAFAACYDAKMKSIDPDGKRFRFVQETYNKRTGGTVKMESLETVFDRRVCKKCKCGKFAKKRSKFIAGVLGPLQKAKFERLSPIMARTRALLTSK